MGEGIKGKGMDGVQPSVHSCLSDLEKSVEEIQKESSVNHKLVTVQELEEKSAALRKLGETLTELKSESRWHICFLFFHILYAGTQQKIQTVLYSGRQLVTR